MSDIFIQSIYIKELRHLKDIKINIDENEKKHLIITGKNGSGKSTVLEAIKEYLKSIESNNHEAKLNSLHEDIELEICKDYDIKDLYNSGQLIFSYFNAKRNTEVIIPTGVEKIELDEKYDIDSKPANQFLKYLVDLKTQQSFARNEGEDEEADKIGLWFENFENSLKDLMGDNSIKLKFDYKNYNFTIVEKHKQPYRFNELSDGYSAVLDIVMDLIIRMEKKASRAYDLQGIVLIDEVETHLHIELQKKIIPFLTNLFPNVQFIVTTHSPFVLNSIKNAVIYDLEKQIKVEDLTSYSYEGIVESYFDIDQYSQEIKNKILRYEELVETNNKRNEEDDEEKKLRKYLKNIPKELSPELYGKFLEIEIKRRTMI